MSWIRQDELIDALENVIGYSHHSSRNVLNNAIKRTYNGIIYYDRKDVESKIWYFGPTGRHGRETILKVLDVISTFEGIELSTFSHSLFDGSTFI